MRDNFYIWASGGILATIIYNPLFLQWLNDLLIELGGLSRIDAYGFPTFGLLFFAWFIFGLIWWVITQFLACSSFALIQFIFAWASSILFFTLFYYPFALLLWIIFIFIIFN